MSESITLAMTLHTLNPETARNGYSLKRAGESSRLPQPTDSKAQLRKACAEMESLFLDQLFREMRKTIPKTGFMHGGRAEEIYTSLMDSQVAKELSAAKGLGLATLLEVQLRDRLASSEGEGVK